MRAKVAFLVGSVVFFVAGCQSAGEAAGGSPAPPAPPSGKNPDRLHQLKDLEVAILNPGAKKLKLWVMDTASKRQEGMMFLEAAEVKDDEGMFFIFPEAQPGTAENSFWMHNTPLALDIAYIAKDGTVVNVGKGMPRSDDKVKPEGEYWYVIETKLGLAEGFGIEKGKKIAIPEKIRTPVD